MVDDRVATHRRPALLDARMPRRLALVIGAMYLGVGLWAFGVTDHIDFAAREGGVLLGFELNALHNLVHVLIGSLGLVLALRMARVYGLMLLAGYGLTFVYGLFAVGNPDINFLALNWADNGLHLLSALAGAAIAFWPARAEANR